MKLSRRAAAVVLIGAGACLLAGPAIVRLFAQTSPRPAGAETFLQQGQEQAPTRREFTITAQDFRFSPSRIEVTQNDLVKLTVESKDVAYSLTIDEYRLSRRVPARGQTTLEFRADQPGTFAFYSNLTSDARHEQARGQLIVRAR
jgi:heme/copper-type cytochrome/quinol oxidase subunit 2